MAAEITKALHGYDGKSLGFDGKRRPIYRADTTDCDKRIVKLWKAKKPMRAIAADVGCSVGTVHRVIHGGK